VLPGSSLRFLDTAGVRSYDAVDFRCKLDEESPKIN